MNGIFSPDSTLMKVLGAVSDVVIISFLWLLCSLPVVTLGASSTAAYYALVKVVRRQRGYLTHEFFRSFRSNLKDAVLLTVIYEVVAFLLVYNIVDMYNALGETNSDMSFYLMVAYVALLVLLIGIAIYTWPVLSRFTVKGMPLFRFSLYAVFRHLPVTLVLLVLHVLTALGLYLFPAALLFLPAVCLWIQSLLMEPVLRKHMTPEMLAQWDGEDHLDE